MSTVVDNSVNVAGVASVAGLWVSPRVVSTLLALSGVIVGLVARDVVMAIYLARRKRFEELADKKNSAREAHLDLVRLYSDPLKDAVTSLKYRLQEIVEKKQASYLLASAPEIPFLEYKRISTLYRIACVLGWIRAIRRERSYLDPQQAAASIEMQAITEFEGALADGAHVELQRLEELTVLWHVSSIDGEAKTRIASLIDSKRAAYLAAKEVLSPRDLSENDQCELAEQCAEIIRSKASVDIPESLVSATAKQAAVIFGIKEAYIYRDWQAAIGDMMIAQEIGGKRHFSVHGFGTFEDMFLDARKDKGSSTARWLNRLEGLIHDLDMVHEGLFDARREQIHKLYQCCIKLEAGLQKRIIAHQAE
ncbi:hypothetical protein [Roseibium sp. Sym1]|uniref:hypothetical protein n=1 Tax=Roseibium sp. Sym1 TaxID=3016006 RepID=UPI0022B32021|nr:hypothetical protein [Roseibium sp. Sym1]